MIRTIVLRQLAPAAAVLGLLTAGLGLGYPLAVTALAQLAFPFHADGSILELDGRAVGSELVGQPFTAAEYFHPRPSAAGDGHDASASAGSNLGPLNPLLAELVGERVDAYRVVNGLAPSTPVPVDAVTASASGLDPHISVANARLQAPRVAAARGMELAAVLDAIDAAVDDRPLGVLGDPGVNVLRLNLALDRAG